VLRAGVVIFFLFPVVVSCSLGLAAVHVHVHVLVQQRCLGRDMWERKREGEIDQLVAHRD
jgi:hypothetical protein